MRKFLTIIMFLAVLPVVAQEMSVEGLARQKKSALKRFGVRKDKNHAILILATEERGFQFKADAQTDIQPDDGDSVLILQVPHKTMHVVVDHADYGQVTFHAPKKDFRKKKVYFARLLTHNPDKAEKQEKQWVEFLLEPKNAILHLDSVQTIVRDGRAQFHLSLGKHPYRVEAPFYETVDDVLEIDSTASFVGKQTEEHILVLPVRLQPLYSFLTVKTPDEACRIYVDNEFIGYQEGVSGHLSEGTHRLSVFIGSLCYYDAPVQLGASQKNVVELTKADLRLQPRSINGE